MYVNHYVMLYNMLSIVYHISRAATCPGPRFRCYVACYPMYVLLLCLVVFSCIIISIIIVIRMSSIVIIVVCVCCS